MGLDLLLYKLRLAVSPPTPYTDINQEYWGDGSFTLQAADGLRAIKYTNAKPAELTYTKYGSDETSQFSERIPTLEISELDQRLIIGHSAKHSLTMVGRRGGANGVSLALTHFQGALSYSDSMEKTRARFYGKHASLYALSERGARSLLREYLRMFVLETNRLRVPQFTRAASDREQRLIAAITRSAPQD